MRASQQFFARLDLVEAGVISTPLWRSEAGSTPAKLNVYYDIAHKTLGCWSARRR